MSENTDCDNSPGDLRAVGTLLVPPGPQSQDTHAAVGQQTTFADPRVPDPVRSALLDQFVDLADAGAVGLVVKGLRDGEPRGWYYAGPDLFQPDRSGESHTRAELFQGAGVANNLTFTVVPFGSEIRIGVDRDEDGVLDGDEARRAWPHAPSVRRALAPARSAPGTPASGRSEGPRSNTSGSR